jgi:hypothetical protein
MGLLRGPDFLYALRFLRLLTTKWEKTDAFKLGIVDKDGKFLKKPETPAEKSAYTIFHKLVFNIKRLINKIPFGRMTIASYLAALWLIKEETGLTDKEIKKVLKESLGCEIDDLQSEINEWYLTNNGEINTGKYALTRDIALPKTGDVLAKKGTLVTITESKPIGSIFGHSVFKAKHTKTNQVINITQEDITQ